MLLRMEVSVSSSKLVSIRQEMYAYDEYWGFGLIREGKM